MNKGLYFRIIAFLLFLTSIFLFLNFNLKITGAVIGLGENFYSINVIFGCLLLISSFLLFTFFDLEEIIKKHAWKKYDINKDSIISDIEQEYLSQDFESEKENKRKTYEQQFYEGHASGGGRVINVETHIPLKGENKGKLVHYNILANARYLWVVDEDGNFIIANRQTFHHEMANMNKSKIDYLHRVHKLPHATLARGKKVYASGEILIEGGLIKEVNTHSGHYLPITIKGGSISISSASLIDEFNKQGIEVFKYFREKAGWKEIKGGAKYN